MNLDSSLNLKVVDIALGSRYFKGREKEYILVSKLNNGDLIETEPFRGRKEGRIALTELYLDNYRIFDDWDMLNKGFWLISFCVDLLELRENGDGE